MRYLFLLLFLGSSLCGMEEGQSSQGREAHDERRVGVISSEEFEAAKPWRDVFSHRNPDEILKGVQRLLQAGEDPNRKFSASNFPKSLATTLLHEAAERGLLKVAMYLLIYGASLDGKDGYGNSVLSAALKRYKTQSFLNGHVHDMPTPDLSVTKFFLLRGADPYQKSLFEIMPLTFIREDDIKVREMLEDFKTYKSNHAKEFEKMQHAYDKKCIRREFERKVQQFGRRNTISGIGEPRSSSTRLNELSEAGKRKRDDYDRDDDAFHSPRSRATFALSAPFAPVRRRRDERR